jgi:hypothetical protein
MDFQSPKPSASSRKTTSIVTLEKEQSVYMLHERANGKVGDFEGCYDLEWMNIPPVARLLKIRKGAAKVKDPSWLRNNE